MLSFHNKLDKDMEYVTKYIVKSTEYSVAKYNFKVVSPTLSTAEQEPGSSSKNVSLCRK